MDGTNNSEKKTKSLDDLFQHITNVGSVLEEKIDGVQKITEKLSERIEEVNTKISVDIRNLEAKHINDHQDIKVLIERVENDVTANQQTNSEEVAALMTKIESHENRINNQDREFRAIQVQLAAANKRNNYQAMRFKELEKATYRGLQHGRGWNVEIDGIPRNVGDTPAQLQEATLKILNAINVRCTEDDIDTIHRLPARNVDDDKVTIVRFRTRKLVRSIHENKRILKDIDQLNIDIAGLTPTSKIYIRASQCPYYRTLGYNCRQLRRQGLITDVRTSNDGRITIKTVTDEFVKISHESELIDMFPMFQDFNFNNIGQDE